MQKETKIGLLVGLGVILAIGVLISDHLSVAERTNPANHVGAASDRSQTVTDPGLSSSPSPQLAERSEPLPEPRRREPAVDPLPQVQLLDERQPEDDPEPTTNSRIWRLGRDDDAAPPVRETPPVDRLVLTTRQPQESTPTRAGDQYHHVKSGESLYTIARDYYGNGEYWRTIYEANPRTVIPSPNALRTGVRILIPMRNPAPAPGRGVDATERQTTEQPAPTRTKTYTIKSGDTLSELAQKFMGSSRHWKKLQEMNSDKIRNPDVLVEGVTIVVPEQ